MKLKTLSAACLAGALLCPSLTAYAGIPVMVDADPLRQIQYATDAQNWLKTVEQYNPSLMPTNRNWRPRPAYATYRTF
jgi:type IV secretion system protein VirB5